MNEPTRVLSIEDEVTVRRSILAYLEDSGFEVLEADNGRTGIEIFDQEHPDVVLCDLRMPELDGLSVLARIAQSAPETPILIVSGTGDMADAIEALKLGAWDYITKPIQDMAVLEHAINKSLERARLIRENREYREHLETSLRKLEEDEAAARRIQFQLLPDVDAVMHGYAFSRYLRPSTFLSGDFLDYFRIDEHRIGFYIADVSGHGVSSAFVTVLLKTTMTNLLERFRRGETDLLLHPDQVLKHINDDIVARQFGKYLTMFYSVLDRRDNALSYSNGGQFPPPILRTESELRFLEQKSLPVGLFPHATFACARETLPDRFALLKVSDGVLEILPHERLQEKEAFLLSQMREHGVQLSDLVLALGLEATPTPLDDVTLMLVKKEN